MSTAGYPSELLIEPWTGAPAQAVARVPGSKSLTNRALVVAALAEGPSVLRGALDCEDTQVMVAALRAIGIEVEHDVGSAADQGSGLLGRHPIARRPRSTWRIRERASAF